MNNRPIKFRIWVKSEKKMYNWHDHQQIIKDAIPDDSGDEWTEDCELMQFTGLTDLGGKEIYEGDVIHYSYKYISKKKDEQEIEIDEDVTGDVRYFVPKNAFVIMGYNKNSLSPWCTNCAGRSYPVGVTQELIKSLNEFKGDYKTENLKFEVVSNIFENPELLK